MKVILVRHGEAVEGAVDALRHLTEHGEEQIQTIADYLSKNAISFSKCYYSGRERTKQTAKIICEQISPHTKLEILTLLEPNANPQALINRLSHFNEDILLVGHLPHVQDFVSELLSQNEMRDLNKIIFHPGSMLILSTEDHVNWHIEHYLNPDETASMI
ncbi:phosphohistidine phosphatase SixA [Candidatus Berkiella cookevillensis]|uniref:Phosphohistidine phosphatase SixA n=1 Tax=Candidatus Berkiella cookevillensis TaxID=437022 RepID=A0A0Q9YVB2_9GAMM|nr:phosphohistidine phosphatase SixA [Candidatus Berkiella cookevillensis]MCS5708414.1 phosphohistidine phosphatase SixA [Candidatus Berkiella cookevillensis]